MKDPYSENLVRSLEVNQFPTSKFSLWKIERRGKEIVLGRMSFGIPFMGTNLIKRIKEFKAKQNCLLWCILLICPIVPLFTFLPFLGALEGWPNALHQQALWSPASYWVWLVRNQQELRGKTEDRTVTVTPQAPAKWTVRWHGSPAKATPPSEWPLLHLLLLSAGITKSPFDFSDLKQVSLTWPSIPFKYVFYQTPQLLYIIYLYFSCIQVWTIDFTNSP